jgi:hypothetical protein
MRHVQLSRADLARLTRVGCFGIATYEVGPGFSYMEWKKRRRNHELDACAQFVAPLLASAVHARLYPSKVFEPRRYKFLIPRNRYFEFDLTKNCVRGYESFWRAGAAKGEYQRGTIVVVQPGGVALAPLLKRCTLNGIPSSRYQVLMGSSAAAVRFAENRSRRDQRCFLFTASNGVEYVKIYPTADCNRKDYEIADKVAKKPSGWNELDG